MPGSAHLRRRDASLFRRVRALLARAFAASGSAREATTADLLRYEERLWEIHQRLRAYERYDARVPRHTPAPPNRWRGEQRPRRWRVVRPTVRLLRGAPYSAELIARARSLHAQTRIVLEESRRLRAISARAAYDPFS